MARGRPIGSSVRQNMIEILYFLQTAHGYHIFKVYKELYPKITLRAIYYHLKKGLDLKEFEIANIKKEDGDYSWGTEAEKIYYKLGPNANPRMDERVKILLDAKPELKTRN
ncbi:MAG: hypothetical protein ACMXX9_00875 [Candidatus Woesearchaeota archaeon]